jgi:NADP-dependent 3-hydroxy acid dehydrogenase YdfG
MASKLKPLDQQVIVLTGTCGGIGLCTTLLPAERGARVVLAARNGRTLGTIVPGADAGVGRQ